MSVLRESFLEALAELSPQERCSRWSQRYQGPAWSGFVAIGKAAEAMARGVASMWPRLSGLVIAPTSVLGPSHWEVVVSTHPELSEASLVAGERLLRWLSGRESVLFLLSGGASALVEVLAPGVAPIQAFQRWCELYSAGLDIVEMNRQRAEMSAIKGGKLLSRLGGRSHTLIWSDVLQGASWVGSGLTWRCPMPEGHTLQVLASGPDLRQAMARQLLARGVRVRQVDHLLGTLEGSVRRLKRWRPAPDEVMLACAEVTVKLERGGRGGRCQALVLEMLEHLRRCGYQLLAAASDGRDGPTDYAGAEGDPGTLARARRIGLEPSVFRQRQASSEFFELLGETWTTGPTGNNLNDLVALAGWQAPPEGA